MGCGSSRAGPQATAGTTVSAGAIAEALASSPGPAGPASGRPRCSARARSTPIVTARPAVCQMLSKGSQNLHVGAVKSLARTHATIEAMPAAGWAISIER